MKRNQPQSLLSKINAITLPARKGIGRGLRAWQRVPTLHKLGLLLLTPLWLGLLAWQPAAKTPEAQISGRLTLSVAANETREIPVPNGGQRLDHTLTQGETLAALFRQWQLPSRDLIALIRAEPSYQPLSNLKAGQDITAVINAKGELHYLEVNDHGRLLNAFRRMGQEFSLVTTP
ncbi:LysM-like peptidoglycan-binding domain-containing protein [Oceanisphaera pacifica]|nr:LysM-like peptidoglycan-binding domain-containing protein [Oceanisphaera pacifica]